MEVNWNEIAGQVMTEVLKILVPVLAVLILKWIVEIWKQLKEKHPELAELIAYAAQLGYAAAEEYFRNREVTGEDKMTYAISRASEYLHSFGINIDVDVIRDCINRYGVNEYKFSWARKPIAEIFEGMKSDPDKEDPEDITNEEEKDHEPVDADDLCLGSDHDDNDADHLEAGEPAVRPGEGLAEAEDGERTADDGQDGQAGRPDSADGQAAA